MFQYHHVLTDSVPSWALYLSFGIFLNVNIKHLCSSSMYKHNNCFFVKYAVLTYHLALETPPHGIKSCFVKNNEQ